MSEKKWTYHTLFFYFLLIVFGAVIGFDVSANWENQREIVTTPRAAVLVAFAATFAAFYVPYRQDKKRDREKTLQAKGLALLVIGELVVLRGTINLAITGGLGPENDFRVYAVDVPASIERWVGDYWKMETTGNHILTLISQLNANKTHLELNWKKVNDIMGEEVPNIEKDKMISSAVGRLRNAIVEIDHALEGMKALVNI